MVVGYSGCSSVYKRNRRFVIGTGVRTEYNPSYT